MGRKTVKNSYWKRKHVSPDAKIIEALLKEQPLSREELQKKAGVPRSTFYTLITLLEDSKIVKPVRDEYALWRFDDVDFEIQLELGKIKDTTKIHKRRLADGTEIISAEPQPPGTVTFITEDDLAQAVGKPWIDIADRVYAYNKAHGLRISRDGLIYKRQRFAGVRKSDK